MMPRRVRLLVGDVDLRSYLHAFFIGQGWDVSRLPVCELVVCDGLAGVRAWQRRRDGTPCVLVRTNGHPRRVPRSVLVLEAPLTPDLLRDAVGSILRARIKLVPKRKPSAEVA